MLINHVSFDLFFHAKYLSSCYDVCEIKHVKLFDALSRKEGHPFSFMPS